MIDYNKTKSGVDTFDQMCSNMTCNRKTRRWPLCVFFGMVNMASINSFVIYSYKKYKVNAKPICRRSFMIELGKRLAEPWMHHRLTIPNLRRTIRMDICEILNIPQTDDNPRPLERRRTICFYCPSRLRRMTTNFCTQCNHAMCAEHRGKLCALCSSK